VRAIIVPLSTVPEDAPIVDVSSPNRSYPETDVWEGLADEIKPSTMRLLDRDNIRIVCGSGTISEMLKNWRQPG